LLTHPFIPTQWHEHQGYCVFSALKEAYGLWD